MRNSQFIRLFVATLSLGLCCAAQVLPVSKVEDPQAQLLQQRYVSQLQELSRDAAAIRFPYPFYFSRTLDVDESQQKRLPAGSIRFENFHGRIALAITGNYYISYSASQVGSNLRARTTFQDVILPLLRVAVAHLDRNIPFSGYAFEVAHHVRTRVLKVDTEGPENVMLYVPRTLAERLAQAQNAEDQQTVLLESEVFLNGQPFTLWLTGDEAPAEVNHHYLARHKASAEPAPSTLIDPNKSGTLLDPRLIPEAELAAQLRARAQVVPDLSPGRLEKLETTYQAVVQKLTSELNEQAHFVSYAPPSFIAFRDGAYLQLNMSTEIDGSSLSSQYRTAALAFDSHIAHLLRPVSRYFHDNPQFEGVDFSTTVHPGPEALPVSVEFMAPFSALACYEKYDCSGQELINRSIVLINGERVDLDLQRAESEVAADTHQPN